MARWILNNRVLYESFHLPVWIQGTIVNVETTGLDPNMDELTACGFVKGNHFSCFVRHENFGSETFRQCMIRKVAKCPPNNEESSQTTKKVTAKVSGAASTIAPAKVRR